MNKILFFLILTPFLLGKTLIANLDVQDIANKIIVDPSDAGVVLFEAGVAEKDVLSELKISVKKRFQLQVEPKFQFFKKIELADDSYITGLCFYPDGSILAVADNNGFIYIYNFCVNEFRRLQILEAGSKIKRLEMSADGRFLIAGTKDKVIIWKFNSCEYCKVQDFELLAEDKDFCLSGDGKILIISGFYKNKICFFKRNQSRYSRIKALYLGSSNPISNICTSYNGNMTICAYQNEDFINLYFYESCDGDCKFKRTKIPKVSLLDFYIPGFKMDFFSVDSVSMCLFNLDWFESNLQARIAGTIKLPELRVPAFFKSTNDFILFLVGYYSGGVSVVRPMLCNYMIQQSLESELILSEVEHKFFGCATSNNYEKFYIAVGCGKRVIIYKEYSVIDEFDFDQIIDFLQKRCRI